MPAWSSRRSAHGALNGCLADCMIQRSPGPALLTRVTNKIVSCCKGARRIPGPQSSLVPKPNEQHNAAHALAHAITGCCPDSRRSPQLALSSTQLSSESGSYMKAPPG